MSCYYIPPEQNFLSALSDFIIEKFSDDAELKVILPTGYNCLQLGRLLTMRQGCVILPNIVPLTDITAESEEIFKIPFENASVMSALEEKIHLAEVISQDKELKFNINQALKFSPKLAKLFYDLKMSGLRINDLLEISTTNQAEHWQLIQEFLSSAYDKWHAKVRALKKSDKAEYQALMLHAELERVSSLKQKLIIAGVYGQNKTELDFLKRAAQLPTCYVIISGDPQVIAHLHSDTSTDIAPDSGVYLPSRLLREISPRNKDSAVEFKALNAKVMSDSDNASLHYFLMLPYRDSFKFKVQTQAKLPVQHLLFNNCFEEAEYIAHFIAEQPEHTKTAIVLVNDQLKSVYCNFLTKYGLRYDDLFGSALAKLPATKLILDVARMLCEDFELKNLFILLKSPLVISDLVIELENALSGMNRFTEGFDDICKATAALTNEEVKDLAQLLANLFTSPTKSTKLRDVLKRVLTIAETLVPNIWHSVHAFEISDFFAEVLHLNWDYEFKQLHQFPEMLELILQGARCFESYTQDSRITICRPGDAALVKFDLVVMPNFIDSHWPPSVSLSPWLSGNMQEELGLHSGRINQGVNLFQFYLLLHNSEVLITLPRKHALGKSVLPSSYLLMLESVGGITCADNVKTPVIASTSTPVIARNDSDEAIQKWRISSMNYNGQDRHGSCDPRDDDCPLLQEAFPTFIRSISATDVETLIRNPRAFHAKKVLKLRKRESIVEPPKLSEFGSFLHSVIEEYTKSYDPTDQHKLERISSIATGQLSALPLPKSTKMVWDIKCKQIAADFIPWDEERRKGVIAVYAEIKGYLPLQIGDRAIDITAIADRVEVMQNGTLSLLDYKTGSVPTQKDVFSGLSPQLVIEGLIAQYGKFSGIKEVKGAKELVYVKIASSAPYITSTTICLSPQELEHHREGLISLLEFYLHHNFDWDIDLLKFNDYVHLLRAK